MWQSLSLFACWANLFIIVSCGKSGLVKDRHTIITTISNATGIANSNATLENGTLSAGAEAGATATVTTIIKTHLHSVKKCAENEKLSKCPAKLCQPQVCEDVGFGTCSSQKEKYQDEVESEGTIPYNNSSNKKCGGPSACICISDYVRNNRGVCIPVKDCPACGGDKNATVGCGYHCSNRCSNYKSKNVSCTEDDVCLENSCVCKKEHVLDDFTGMCVLPKDCSTKNAPDPEDGKESSGDGETEEDGDKSPCETCNGTCDQSGENSCENSEHGQCEHKDSGEEEESCAGDENAIPGCDEECKNRCPGKKPENCKCPKNSCMCKEDYVYNPATNNCVKPDKCDEASSEDTTVTTEKSEDRSTTKKSHKKIKIPTTATKNTTSEETETSCAGDENAIPGCDKECKNRCPGKKPKHCKCSKNSCMCKKDYVYNPATNNCVKPDMCGKSSNEDSNDTSQSSEMNSFSEEVTKNHKSKTKSSNKSSGTEKTKRKKKKHKKHITKSMQSSEGIPTNKKTEIKKGKAKEEIKITEEKAVKESKV